LSLVPESAAAVSARAAPRETAPSDSVSSRDRERTRELEATNAQLMLTAEDLASTLAALAEANARLQTEKGERERVEGELRLAHRLEAVGQLAAGVAHEINTPIQYIGDSVHFLQSAFDDLLPLLARVEALVPSLREAGATFAADEIESAWEAADAGFIVEQVPSAVCRTLDGIGRVAAIVRAMKAFAHPGNEVRAPADLNEALKTTVVVSRNEYKYVADVVTDFGEIPLVSCQIGEINQVFLNVIVNAAHAVGERAEQTGVRGLIGIETRRDGDDVVVKISDSGSGIPSELHEKIFDPFFTTKTVGKGTGQGLTIARSIIVKHGGSLSFTSEVDKGTVFEIRLPAPREASNSWKP
jgi:signal transduction histidine kinase